MGLSSFRKYNAIKNIVFKGWLWDARRKISWITPYIEKKDLIVDVGSGPGSVSYLLKRQGYRVVPIDVGRNQFIDEAVPVLYDGKNMPFKDAQFDVALISTVLHHTQNPELVIKEAKRVASKIIIIEDIVLNPIQKQLLKLTDSILNLEFVGHPFNFRTDAAWKETFKNLNFELTDAVHHRIIFPFSQAVYCLR